MLTIDELNKELQNLVYAKSRQEVLFHVPILLCISLRLVGFLHVWLSSAVVLHFSTQIISISRKLNRAPNLSFCF